MTVLFSLFPMGGHYSFLRPHEEIVTTFLATSLWHAETCFSDGLIALKQSIMCSRTEHTTKVGSLLLGLSLK